MAFPSCCAGGVNGRGASQGGCMFRIYRFRCFAREDAGKQVEGAHPLVEEPVKASQVGLL